MICKYISITVYINFSSVGRGLPLSGGKCHQVQNLCIYKAKSIYLLKVWNIAGLSACIYCRHRLIWLGAGEFTLKIVSFLCIYLSFKWPQLALYMDQNISSLKKPPKLFSESFMKFSADFVCQFCWRIDCRADERRDTGEILENGRDFWFRINHF